MKRTNILLLAVFVLCSSCAVASDAIPAAKQKKPIALIGGTIHTVSGAVIENATILFDKGKIVALGTNVTIPADAERINIAGKHVYPGIIDSYTSMGLTEIGSVRGTIDQAETGLINPNVRAEVAVNPESELIPVARAGGIAIVATMPSGGLISGLGAALMLDGWTWEDLTLKGGLGLVVNWPSMIYTPSPRFRVTKEEWQKQRDDQLKAIREAFSSARAYMTAKNAEKQQGVPMHDSDPRWQAMIPVLQGTIPVFVEANEMTQIQSAITWAETEGVKLVIVGGRDAWLVRGQLKAKDIPVIITDVQSAPSRIWQGYNEVFTLPLRLQQAGLRFCIAGDGSPSNSRNVPYHAANAAAYGLPKDEALKSVTLYAAQILGIADKVGSLEAGKDATLIVTNGDPLEPPTVTEHMFIQGKKIDLGNKHKQLYEKYKQKYMQLNDR
ncbi:MAG: amidohydrolase family protein [Ignavibacteriales bacterium]|nr:amidohydrolase family protein [Ignavibacteriales bacterium]